MYSDNVKEVVSTAATAYAHRLYKDGVITRKERQSFTSVVEKLSAATISDEVMEKLGCGPNEARFYIEECLANQNKRVERNEAEWFMWQLIKNDSKYKQKMYEKVEELWHQEHSSARAEWTAELKKAQETLAAVQQEAATVQSELSAAKAHKEQCEADAIKAMQLQEDIEKRIQERLAMIRKDRAKALVDDTRALALTTPSSTNTSTPQQNGTWLITYDGYSEPITEVAWGERWLDAVSSWTQVCGTNEKRGAELAAFFLASYALKQHLIISGECAEKLADTAAHIATGRDCVKVYASDHCSVTDLIKEIAAVPHDCICLLNGLEQNHSVVKAVMNHFNDSLFILTVPYYESLVMEPASLYTTFFPVCSEEFCVGAFVTDDSDRLSCKLDLRSNQHTNPGAKKLRDIRADQASWFSSGFFSPMLIDRCARFHYEMKSMLTTQFYGEKDVKAAMLNLLYAPLMRCLRRKDILSAQVAKFDILDERQKKRLLAFAGVEKE